MNAELIVEKILADMTDRRGFRQAWDNCDEEIQQEIKDRWMEIIREYA